MGENESGGQLREGELRLVEEEGSKEFTMRELEDNRRRGIMRDVGGGEWDLRSGRVWGERGVSGLKRDNTGVTGKLGEEEQIETICCCDEVTGVKILITLFAVINLGIIATGGIGFTLGLVDYWSEQDLFTPVMVIIINSIFSIIIVTCYRLGQVV